MVIRDSAAAGPEFVIGRTSAGASVYLGAGAPFVRRFRCLGGPNWVGDEFWVTKRKRGLLRLKIAA